MHRPDHERAGLALCGRSPRPERADPPREPRRSTATPTRVAAPPGPTPARQSGSWRVPARWVRLAGPMVLHWPHPDQPDRVMCGRMLDPEAPVHVRHPVAWPPCEECRAVRAAAVEAQRAEERAAAARPTPRLQVQERPLPSEPVRREWKSPGWVVWPARGGAADAHRPNPERRRCTVCGRCVPMSTPVDRSQPAQATPCGRCADLLQRRQVELGLATRRIKSAAEQDRYDRARSRGTSIRTVSGGLPTLGRDR
jgi:hypothetical protein